MKKNTILDILRMKEEGRKIRMLTAYDFHTARIMDEAGVDIILVGDSLGNVVLGFENTLPVTVDDMLRHAEAVVRARKKALVVVDMPFMSYQVSTEDAKDNAGKLIKRSGAEAVKLEGGLVVEETIKAITDMDIPVMGHIGLTPQSVHRMGGYRVQGKDEIQREKLMIDALAVQRAGAFSVVLEGIPDKLANDITNKLNIPTIGIGAGVHCDGQVLVINDILGLSGKFRPKFVKQYVQLEPLIKKAVQDYLKDVEDSKFPGSEHSFH